MKHVFCVLSLLVCFCCCATSSSCTSRKSKIRVVSWNVQTFFDGVTDGTEYAQFKGASSRWTERKYRTRLERLSTALCTFDADIVVLEELEKQEQLYDIYNQLSGSFHVARNYTYGAFAKADGSAIGCGVLSRYPLTKATVHALDIGTERTPEPALRPLLEVGITCKTGQTERVLTLFVCHWKSKLGADSAVWRRWQERVLNERMTRAVHAGGAALCCGDYNQDIFEFDTADSCVLLAGRAPLAVYSPWLDDACFSDGSYWYKGEWERIDHFFAAGVFLTDFCADSAGSWADEAGRPIRYDLLSGEGYSDHLPIRCAVSFGDEY